jgi:hypothetical protein
MTQTVLEPARPPPQVSDNAVGTRCTTRTVRATAQPLPQRHVVKARFFCKCTL